MTTFKQCYNAQAAMDASEATFQALEERKIQCLITTACGVLAFESNPGATHGLLLDFGESTSSAD